MRNLRTKSHGARVRGFFQFHTMNAFAEGDRIEVTFPWYDSYSLTRPSSRLELHRLLIDTKKRTVSDQALDEQPCEFSRINDAHLGRKARYGYVGLRDLNVLIKSSVVIPTRSSCPLFRIMVSISCRRGANNQSRSLR